jgi:hypothetical protein
LDFGLIDEVVTERPPIGDDDDDKDADKKKQGD